METWNKTIKNVKRERPSRNWFSFDLVSSFLGPITERNKAKRVEPQITFDTP